MANIDIKSYNQILGDLVRKMIADTPLSDVSTGSVLLTLLEAVATSDYENNIAVLNVLELLNLDSTSNSDLDSAASNYGLTRAAATRASGLITIADSSITKRSTSLYPIKPAPIAGTTVLYVNNAEGWANAGTLVIGRGTVNFEGPITYTGITYYGTFYAIQLASALQNDHLISESIIDIQGTSDRVIPAGTKVKIPANNINPEILYTVLRTVTMPAGEDVLEDILITADIAGSQGNAGINTIIQFSNLPFPTALVTNTQPLINGADVETDIQLRDRIKSYASSLARGTRPAILNALIGVSDPDDGKQITSAVITEPVNVGEPSLIYIDDSTGFQPIYLGQSVDALLSNANGGEEFLQLSNFPLPRPQVVNFAVAPYQLVDGMNLRVAIDGVEESIYFTADQFSNISAARNEEVITVINDTATLFKCRLTNESTQLLLYPTAYNAETIQVISSGTSTDANALLKFPVNQFSYIKLYKNNNLLHEKEKAAQIETNNFAAWNITASGNLILSVDGTPVQDQSFSQLDFNGASFSSLSLEDWVAIFNSKFAGITASSTPVGTMIIKSNKSGSKSSLFLYGGSYLNKMFGDVISSTGQDSNFKLNRQTGAVRIIGGLQAGDEVSAGLVDAKGSVVSRQIVGPTISMSLDSNSRPAEFVTVADSASLQIRAINLPISGKLYAVKSAANTLRIIAPSTSTFKNIQPKDFIYITNRGNGTVVQGAVLTITDFSTISGTLSIAGNNYTAGVDFIPASSNKDTATAIAIAINSNLPAGMTCYSTNQYIILHRVASFALSYAGAGIIVPASSYLFDANSWFNSASCGLYKVTARGEHVVDGIDTYIEIENDSAVGGELTIADNSDIQGFYSEVYPQVWRGSYLVNPAASTITDIVNSINSTITGVIASVYRTSYIRLTSSTENGGSIAVPVSVGNAVNVFVTQQGIQTGNDSHVANKAPEKDLVAFFERTAPVSANVWLDRHVYSDLKGSLSANNDPNANLAYGEILNATNIGANSDYDSMINVTSGNNRGQMRSIKGITGANEVRTNRELATTNIDYIAGDEYQVVKSAQLNAADTMVVIFDEDPVAKTIDLKFSRQGRVNAGSQSLTFIPTNTALSANDDENEPGVDFGTLSVWGTASTQTNTNFNNYMMAFRARNWYATGGALSGNAILMLRANQFGALGSKIRFKTSYPVSANTTARFAQTDYPDYSLIEYIFGAGIARGINVSAGTQVSVADVSGFYSGLPTGGKMFRYTFGTTPTTPNFSTTLIGDIITMDNCGFSSANKGVFSVRNVDDLNKTIDVYNPFGSATVIGNAASYSFQVPNAAAIDGTYFVLALPTGQTIAFWYDRDNAGTPIPAGALLADYNVEINTVLTGMTAIDVATETAAFIQASSFFSSATNSGGTTDTVTIVYADEGPTAAPVNGSPSTGIYNITTILAGVASTYEIVSYPSALLVLPLIGTAASDIADAINADSNVLNCTVINAGDIVLATREDYYIASGAPYSTTLSYGHDPIIANNNYSDVKLYDSYSYVNVFQNLNPNFTLKTNLVLSGVVPFYRMDTTVNADDTVGELFKLVPITYDNIQHQMTHKALSQLKIIADVHPANNHKRIQMKSKLLGSFGAIEVVGGRGNDAKFSIIGESDVVDYNSNKYLRLSVPAFPEAFDSGDYVKLQNEDGVRRLNRWSSTDSMNVVKVNDETYEYHINHKATNFNKYVKFSIVDANSVAPLLYPTANMVWRWQFNDSGKVLTISDATGPSTVASPGFYNSIGTLGAPTSLHIDNIFLGSVSLPSTFDLSISDTPAQGDYVTFTNSAGDDYAVWFSVDGNLTAPTGASYLAATNKVKVDVLSAYSPNQHLSAFASAISLLIIGQYSAILSVGANITDVAAGDLLIARGMTVGSNINSWRSTNLVQNVGDGEIAGWPIVNVDIASRYIDVVNPYGVPMNTMALGIGSIGISATPVIRWTPKHSAKIAVSQSLVSSGIATLNTVGPHFLNIGDTFVLSNNGATPTTNIVTAVPNFNTIQYATAVVDGAYNGGALINSAWTRSKYSITSLGYNNLFRLKKLSGDSPMFVSAGVAIDDVLVLRGNTFSSLNNGEFRVLGVDEDSIIYENSVGKDEQNTIIAFNNTGMTVNWVANYNKVTGLAGAFENLSLGVWVKKVTDEDIQYRQIIARNGTSFSDATEITLGSVYSGTTSISEGVSYDQVNDVNKGLYLSDISDIAVYEGDAARINDTLFISTVYNNDWFSANNAGSFTLQQFGSNATSYKVFMRVNNAIGSAETNRLLSVQNTDFYIQESNAAKMYSIKRVEHAIVNINDANTRVVFLTPGNRAYKWTQTNRTSITSLGKLGFSTDIVTGIDGYQYYIGLLRTSQRIVDGFEPDAASYPGRRAIGGAIEILPPLPRRIQVAISVTTQNGVNLSEITNEIKSAIINYVGSLGVGEDVILSSIIVKVMGINGVAAVTFITPTPDTERITVGNESKAFIVANDISIA